MNKQTTLEIYKGHRFQPLATMRHNKLKHHGYYLVQDNDSQISQKTIMFYRYDGQLVGTVYKNQMRIE